MQSSTIESTPIDSTERLSEKVTPRPAAKSVQSRVSLLRKPALKLGLFGLIFLIVGVGLGFFVSRTVSNPVVVTVNGEAIRREELNHRLNVAAGPQVLQQMIKETEQIQFAEKMGVLPKDAEVEAKFVETSKQPNFAETLANSRQTSEDVKRGIRVNLSQ